MTPIAPRSLSLVRADFPILGTLTHGYPLTYLDNAATTQKPRPVLDAIMAYYTTANSNIGRGYYELSQTATDRYEQARATVTRWLNAAHPDEIVFTRGTTDSINLVADTFASSILGAGDQVVVTGMEHNSNLLPWRRLCERLGAELVVVGTNPAGRVDPAVFSAALGPKVRLAAVAHVCADFYCFSGHKVYAPMGSGALYGRRALLSALPPYQVGGGTVKEVSLDVPVTYVPAPARLEAGTPDIGAAVGLAAAVDYLTDLGWEAIREHDQALVRYAVEALQTVPSVRVIGDPGADPAGIVSIVVDGVHPYDVGGHLDRHGIAVRSGVHCASTFLDSLGLLGTVRLSFAVYNTEEEIDRVRDALRTVAPGEWTRDHPTTRFLDPAPARAAKKATPRKATPRRSHGPAARPQLSRSAGRRPG